MKYRKLIGLALCLVLVLGAALPGTLAVSVDTASSGSEITVSEDAKTVSGDTASDGTQQKPAESGAEDAAGKECNCGAADGVHAATCPLYTAEKAAEEVNHIDGCTGEDCAVDGCECGCHKVKAEDTEKTRDKEEADNKEEADGEEDLDAEKGENVEEEDDVEEDVEEAAEHIESCTGDGCAVETCACPCHVEEFYEKLMACGTKEELEELLDGYSEVKLQTIAAALQTEAYSEKYNDIIAHIEEVVPAEEPEIPQTVTFTDAGPFMPAVTVTTTGARAVRRAARAAETENGLILNKTAKANADGSYNITLEAYVTGEVTTVTKTTPVDIVLVLDQSGSMSYSFTGASNRQAAMKNAVNSFISAVNAKYSDEADHRMAIVTFGSSANTLRGWTFVNDAGASTLQGNINSLPDEPSGATRVDLGMEQAVTLMGSGYNYSGTNRTRQKVVIVFTDGVPTTSTDFDTSVANTAISSAKSLKDSGVTVYSIGIFNGANPTQMYGEKADTVLHPKDCNGKEGEAWGENIFTESSDDVSNVDVPAANRFLNCISSNIKSCSNIGLVQVTSSDPYYTYKGSGLFDPDSYITSGWKITEEINKENDGYYLTAGDASALNNIFTTISQQIGGASMQLDSTTVVKDVISPYFTVPANVSDVELYTADCTDGTSYTFGDKAAASDINAAIENDTLSVSGFNFSENWCGTDNGTAHGKKLIIEFTVTPKDDFLGGDGVPTNGEDSGVYASDGTAVETFDVPTVNVPVKEVSLSVTDKNVYLTGGLTKEQLLADSTAECGNVKLDLTQENYGLEKWQTEFVTISTALTANGTSFPEAGLTNLTEDVTYKLTLTVSGGENNSKSAEAENNINVFTPEQTCKDGAGYYGDKFDITSNTGTDLKWKHGETVSTSVDMIGESPELVIECSPESGVKNGIINTKQDIEVNAKATIGETDVTKYVTFVHESCSESDCKWTEPAAGGNPAFLIHVKTCSLTITKSGGASDEPYVFTVYKDGEKYTEVSITGNGGVTICELPVGTYTIAEDSGWSWRYTAACGEAASLSADNPTGTITCTNSSTNNKWLNGFSEVVTNIFGIAKQ